MDNKENRMDTQCYNHRDQLEQRRYLRKNSTSAEVALWCMLKGKQVMGVKFRRQFSVGPYILDFYSPQLRLCIELDGADHFTMEGSEYDYLRTEYLKNKHGIHVIRFENNLVFQNPTGVLHEIECCITQLSSQNLIGETSTTVPLFQGDERSGGG